MRVPLKILLIVFLAVDVSSQPTGDVSVRILDTRKAAIVGAEVVLKLNDSTNVQTTNNSGIANFKDLSAGKYEIIVRKEGFNNFEDSIVLENKATQIFDITLDVALIKAEVEVSEDKLNSAEIENFGGSRNMTEVELASLPDDPEELENGLRRIAAAGGTGEQLTISINGIKGGAIPPKEAIRAVRINRQFFSAQYEGANGGGIEIYTKAGLESFRGGVGIKFGNSRFDARNPYVGSKPTSSFTSLNFNISGPLVKKRSSIIFGGIISHANVGEVVNAEILDNNLDIVKYRDSSERKTNGQSFNLTIDYDVSEKSKLFISSRYGSISSENAGSGQFRLPTTLYKIDSSYFDLKAANNVFVSSWLLNQTRLELSTNNRIQKSNSDSIGIDVAGAFVGGGGQIDASQRETKFEVDNDTSWQFDGYTLAFGGKIRAFFLRNFSNSNTNGKYIFNGRIAPKLTADENVVLDSFGNPVMISISSLEAYRRTLHFQEIGMSPDEIRQMGGGASQFVFQNGNLQTNVNVFDFAGYIQNALKVRKDLTASFGVRYEKQAHFGVNTNFAPRLGLVWVPSLNQSNPSPIRKLPRISVGTGLFFERISEMSIFEVRKSGTRFTYIINEYSALNSFPNSAVAYAEPNGGIFNPTIDTLDSEIRQPYIYLTSVIVEKQLQDEMTITAITGYSKTNHALRSRWVGANIADSAFEQGNIYQTESSGIVNNLFFILNWNFSATRYFDVKADYGYRNVKDNIVGGGGFSNSMELSDEYARSAGTLKHSFSIIAQSQLPFGISLTSIFNAVSGSPFNITLGRDSNGDGLFTERPAFASGQESTIPVVITPFGELNVDPKNGDEIIPRNFGLGPARYILDMNFSKTFAITMRNQARRSYRLNLSARINNVLNKNNSANPVGQISSPSFLQPVSYINQSIGFLSSKSPRSFNFGVYLSF